MPQPDREHLRRLRDVWIKYPLYFLTVCTHRRRPILVGAPIAGVLTSSWRDSMNVHGWVIGRYVIMPDHVHFFAAPEPDAKSLSAFMRDWKKWTARQIITTRQVAPPVWQPEFFDHVLRSPKSYSEKWDYVRQNPVRAGFVDDADTWPYSGECEKLGF
ncbi:MAG: transposase [Opitutae bacterium]|nr:transposase [Opitutae bacterium]